MSDPNTSPPTYPRPEGVRVKHRDGTATECELAWGGVDDDGIALWEVSTPLNLTQGDSLHVDILPGRTSISIPSNDEWGAA